MGVASIPENETARVLALRAYALLDTESDPAYDAFARIASEVCEMPVAFVSLVDSSRQWFKARVGIPNLTETPRDIAFCAHALTSTTLFEVPDTTRDARFADNPLVTGKPHFRAYFGAPLVDRDGFALGTLCVLDYRARSLSQEQRSTLLRLAASLVALIETRKGVSPKNLEHVSLLSRALDLSAEPMAIVKVERESATATATATATIVFVNQALSKLFGYEATELVGRAPEIFFGPQTNRRQIERLRSSSFDDTSASERVYLYTASGEPRYIDLRDRSIDERHRIVSLKDLTLVHASQEALVRTNERLHSLIDNNIDAILTVDTAGICIDSNAAARTLFHIKKNERIVYETGTHESRGLFEIDDLTLSSLQTGEPLSFRKTFARPDGERFALDCKAIPILVRGRFDGAYIVAKDISESIRTAELIERQARRTHALCLLAASKGENEDADIVAALEIVLSAFDMQCGYVAELVGDTLTLNHITGEHIVEPGTKIPLANTHVHETLSYGKALAIADIASVPHRAGLPTYANWHGYVSAPLSVNGAIYGAIGFLARRPIAFDEADCDFVTLVAALISAILERHVKREQLDKLAFTDALTGLPNRAKFLADLDIEVSRSKRQARSFALHFVDLDGFKGVNDRLGHAAGDRVLEQVALRLLKTIRHEDLAGRLGGDEFVVLQADVAEPSQPESLGSRLVEALSQPYECGNERIYLTASIGIAVFPEDGADGAAILQNADTALYRAKSRGKHRIERARVSRTA